MNAVLQSPNDSLLSSVIYSPAGLDLICHLRDKDTIYLCIFVPSWLSKFVLLFCPNNRLAVRIFSLGSQPLSLYRWALPDLGHSPGLQQTSHVCEAPTAKQQFLVVYLFHLSGCQSWCCYFAQIPDSLLEFFLTWFPAPLSLSRGFTRYGPLLTRIATDFTCFRGANSKICSLFLKLFMLGCNTRMNAVSPI